MTAETLSPPHRRPDFSAAAGCCRVGSAAGWRGRCSMVHMALAAGLTATLEWAGAGQACARWNTREFFETSAVDDVRNCLKGGPQLTTGVSVTSPRCSGRRAEPAVIRALLEAGRGVVLGYEVTANHVIPNRFDFRFRTNGSGMTDFCSSGGPGRAFRRNGIVN